MNPPVIEHIADENRDPKVYWHEKSQAYYMVLFLEGNQFGIFRSENLQNWVCTQTLELDKAWEFWFLAVWVAVFQGAIQSLSRSYFARIIPKEKSTEYFGFFDIFGKGAAFVGTLLMGISTQLFHTSRAGVAMLALMFAAGFVLFRMAVRHEPA